MTKNNLKIKKFHIGVMFVIALCICFTFGAFLRTSPVMAYTEAVTSWSNLNFASNSTTSVYPSPTGWTKGFSDSTATSGTINLDKYNKSMYLESNSVLPTKLNDNADNYVLMINARNKQNDKASAKAVQYYTNASSLSLDAYSNYKVIVWVRALQDAQGSIYITGLKSDLGFENITYSHASEWTQYTFYITTGKDVEKIKTELWLGSKDKNPSASAVFFDNLEVFKISNNETPATETAENKLVSAPANKNDRVKYINLDQRTSPTDIINADFENEDISNWSKIVSAMKSKTFRGVLDLSTENISNSKKIYYLGTDFTKNNKKALVLYTEEDVTSYFGLESADINVAMSDVIKLSLNAKASLKSGSAYITLTQNDILNADNEVIEEIETKTETIEISSKENNKFLNDYISCSFYIKGSSLYNTSFKLKLTLGSDEQEAEGVVAFDNITIEYLSESNYTSVSTGTYVKKVNLQSSTNTFGITNSTFNTTEKAESALTYPLTPTSWAHNTGDEDSVYFGVINTNTTVFNAHKSEFKISANPGNPEGFLSTDKDTNNILMMYNFRDTYQSATSSSFDLDTNSYYKLSFAYKLLPTSSIKNILFVYITDSDGNILYADEGISGTNGNWKNYELYISSNSYSNSLKLILSLGNEDNNLTGQAFFDNVTVVKQENLTKEEYDAIAVDNKVLDFEEGNFNLVKDEGNDFLTALRYNGSLEEGTMPEYGIADASGGIIDEQTAEEVFDVQCSPENENALKYMMVIKTFNKATYSMTAMDDISLTAGTYYRFTIYIKTITQTPEDYEGEFGAEFGLSGLKEKIENVLASDWTKYYIYVNCTEDATVNLRFAFKSLDMQTTGTVFFDNYEYTTIEADDFNVTRLNFEGEKTYLFIGDTNADTDEEETTSSFNATALWYAIPTAILAVSLILAIVAYLMKKVKIKKWEKRRINQYDRERTVHRDVIRAEAETRRNAQVKELNEQIKHCEEEIAKIDDIRSKRQGTRRSENLGKITRSAEREFKQFAKRRTAIENRIIMLNKQIDNMNTAEYLLSVQHKIAVEKARAEREAREKSFIKQKKEKTSKKK